MVKKALTKQIIIKPVTCSAVVGSWSDAVYVGEMQYQQ